MQKLEVISATSNRCGPVPEVVDRLTTQLVDTPSRERATHIQNVRDEFNLLPNSEGVEPPPITGQFIFKLTPGGFKLRVVTPVLGMVVGQAWEFLMSRSYLGWKIALQPIIHSPSDDLLVELAERGAVDDLNYLFASRKAVIRDDDDFHNKLLYVSIPISRWLCFFLVNAIVCQAGVNSNVRTVKTLLRAGLKWPRKPTGL